MHIEPMDLTVTTAPAAFILTQQATLPFTLSGGAGAIISLQLNPSLAGGVDLKGPQGDPALRALSAFVGGQPRDDEVVAAGQSPYSFTLTESECIAEALVAATGTTVFTIKNEGVTIGTITFPPSGTVGVVDISLPIVDKGDLITIHSPVTQDASIADLTFLLA